MTEETLAIGDVVQRARVAVLLQSLPGWQADYTASLDMAKWLIEQAGRVGWDLIVADRTDFVVPGMGTIKRT